MWGVLVSYMMASDIFSSLVIGPDSFVYCLQLLQVLTRFSGFNRKAMMMIKLTRPLMKLRQNRFWQLVEGEGLLLLTGTKFTPDDKLHYTQMKLICRMFSSQLYARVLQKTAGIWHIQFFPNTQLCMRQTGFCCRDKLCSIRQTKPPASAPRIGVCKNLFNNCWLWFWKSRVSVTARSNNWKHILNQDNPRDPSLACLLLEVPKWTWHC